MDAMTFETFEEQATTDPQIRAFLHEVAEDVAHEITVDVPNRLGGVPAALARAAEGVAPVARSGEPGQWVINRTTGADALHQSGRVSEAAARFREEESRQHFSTARGHPHVRPCRMHARDVGLDVRSPRRRCDQDGAGRSRARSASGPPSTTRPQATCEAPRWLAIAATTTEQWDQGGSWGCRAAPYQQRRRPA